MKVKSFAALKRAVKEYPRFEIVEHYIKPEHTGEVRIVTKAQTNGFYSAVFGNADHEVSKANYGKGYWMDFGTAQDWEFSGEDIVAYRRGNPVFRIRLLGEEEN